MTNLAVDILSFQNQTQIPMNERYSRPEHEVKLKVVEKIVDGALKHLPKVTEKEALRRALKQCGVNDKDPLYHEYFKSAAVELKKRRGRGITRQNRVLMAGAENHQAFINSLELDSSEEESE